MARNTVPPDGKHALCVKAEELCLNRIREIMRQADPSDPALRHLLADIERLNRVQLDEVAHLGLAEPEADADLTSYFPSVRERLGEAPLNRDSAMYFIETLKEEASHFFQRMARSAMDDGARTVYSHIALRELCQVARLRSVIL